MKPLNYAILKKPCLMQDSWQKSLIQANLNDTNELHNLENLFLVQDLWP